MSARALIFYVVLVFALSWGIQFGVINAFHDLESDAAAPFLVACMFVPTLVTLGFLLFHKPARRGLLWKPTWMCAPLIVVATLVPTLIAFAVVAVATYAGWGQSGWFAFSDSGVSISGGPWLLGRGAQTWPLFAANVAVTGLAFALMNGIVAAGEEFGWRGFLQGKLIDRFGPTGAIVLLGSLWSMWHLPGQLAGYNYPETPILGALVLSPIELIAMSFFLGWLTLRAKSFIPAAVAHGAGNSIQEGVTANLHLTTPRLYEDLTTVSVTVLVGLVCWAMIEAGKARMPAANTLVAAE